MIEECNFKSKVKKDIHSDLMATRVLIKKGDYCRLTGINQSECKGEENCVLFQTYKLLTLFLVDYTDIRKEIADKLQKFKVKK